MGKNRTEVSGEEAVVVKDDKSGSWAEMNPEILATFFVRIPVDEMLRTVPLVCKGWMKVVVGSSCWREIDISEWCLRRTNTSVVDTAVIKLVRLSNATFQRLSAYRLGNPSFTFMANCGRCLTVLQMPMSNITDNVVLNHIRSLPNLKELDISGCSLLTVIALEAFGNECKSLVCLKRNMIPEIMRHTFELYISYGIDDSEAKTIANSMPNLQHLEICYSPFSDVGLSEILTKCKSLSRLDFTGSWHEEWNPVELKGGIRYIGLWKPFISKILIESLGGSYDLYLQSLVY